MNRFFGAVLLALLAQPAWAQIEPQLRGPPPPHAYEDCRGKKAGDVVQHVTPGGKVAATCQDSPEGMVARPNQPPPRPANGEPPPHAYEECRGSKKVGDAAHHMTPNGNVAATCAEGPKGVMARPDQPPVPPPNTQRQP